MYLTYNEYIEMGGTLENAAFNLSERKAEYLINGRAGGRTGERIRKLEEVPQAVKDCVFELIAISPSEDKQISSESQSQGGISESVSYVTKTDKEIKKQQLDTINDFLDGGGCAWLLYRGAKI